MKIIDRLKEERIHISFEVFPPKTDEGIDKVLSATAEIAKLDPAFISVTYGAGGGTSRNTAKIASYIKDDLNVLSDRESEKSGNREYPRLARGYSG